MTVSVLSITVHYKLTSGVTESISDKKGLMSFGIVFLEFSNAIRM